MTRPSAAVFHVVLAWYWRTGCLLVPHTPRVGWSGTLATNKGDAFRSKLQLFNVCELETLPIDCRLYWRNNVFAIVFGCLLKCSFDDATWFVITTLFLPFLSCNRVQIKLCSKITNWKILTIWSEFLGTLHSLGFIYFFNYGINNQDLIYYVKIVI